MSPRYGIPDIVSRIWARDYSVWPEPSPGGGGDWLGWLNLPSSLRFGIGLATPAQQQQLSRFSTLNVLGMGGSSLTCLVLSELFQDESNQGETPRLNVFDSVHPAFVKQATERLDLSSAAFVVASKSGTTSEPLALESVFRAAIRDAGVKNISDHFIALTDPGTPLAERASSGEFGMLVETPPTVGGRYSALSAFGMFPASACGMPTDRMAISAMQMAERCKDQTASNPGVELGLFLAYNALRGRDKLTLLIAPELRPFGLWLEQLIAESTGKDGRGLIPIVGEPEIGDDDYGEDRQFVAIRTQKDSTKKHAIGDHPVFEIVVEERESIAGEFFRWEFAIAVASCAIGVYPFDQPDVEAAKDLARNILEATDPPRVDIGEWDDALTSLPECLSEGDYVAFVDYSPDESMLATSIDAARQRISRECGVATSYGLGPRYLHSTGQLHKGGPNSVYVIAIFNELSKDVPIPGQRHSLGDLIYAQAAGDVAAIRAKGRRASLVRVGGEAR